MSLSIKDFQPISSPVMPDYDLGPVASTFSFLIPGSYLNMELMDEIRYGNVAFFRVSVEGLLHHRAEPAPVFVCSADGVIVHAIFYGGRTNGLFHMVLPGYLMDQLRELTKHQFDASARGVSCTLVYSKPGEEPPL